MLSIRVAQGQGGQGHDGLEDEACGGRRQKRGLRRRGKDPREIAVSKTEPAASIGVWSYRSVDGTSGTSEGDGGVDQNPAGATKEEGSGSGTSGELDALIRAYDWSKTPLGSSA